MDIFLELYNADLNLVNSSFENLVPNTCYVLYTFLGALISQKENYAWTEYVCMYNSSKGKQHYATVNVSYISVINDQYWKQVPLDLTKKIWS